MKFELIDLETDIDVCTKILKMGGVILYPTDTVWGIGCDATDAEAVERIYNIKMRTSKKSLIILIDDILKLEKYVEKVPPIAYDLVRQYEEPLTIIYPNAKNIAKNIIADDNSIAIRVVKDDFCKRMINLLGRPVVSTSANITRDPTPLTFGQISNEIKNSVDYIAQHGQDRVVKMKASTIIKIDGRGNFKTIRQ